MKTINCQSEPLLPRHKNVRCVGFAVGLGLLIPALIQVVISGLALAELPQSPLSQRSRSLPYQPLTSESPTPTGHVPTVSQHRTLAYEPVNQQAAEQQPVARQNGDSQRYTVYRPIPFPQEGSAASTPGRDRDSRSVGDVMLPLPRPAGVIDNPETNRYLNSLSNDIQAAKSGTAIQPGDTVPDNPSIGNAPPIPGTNAGISPVDEILPQNDINYWYDWYAMKDGSPIPLQKQKDSNRFFAIAEDRTTILYEVVEISKTAAEQTQAGTTPSLADDQMRNAVLLIVTTMAVLAAFGVSFLAFDYKHRWEQEIVAQNNRLLGQGAMQGTLGELDLLEPETLRFSPHDYRPLDDSFDHSFRTIA